MAERIGQAYVELTVKGAKEVSNALNAVKGSLFNLKTAFAATIGGLSVIGLGKEFAQVGSQVEQFRLTLRTVIKDAKEADKAFDWAREFARTTPFNTDEVVRAFTLLKSVGIKNAEDTMKAIGDTAMVFGRSIEDTASALISMETEVWRRFGVEIDRTGKEWTIKLGDRIITTKADINSLREALVSLLRDGFEGGMKRAENTWVGAWRTISSLWWEFEADVAGEAGSGGVFDTLRQAIIKVKDAWASWVQTDDYKRFVQDVQNRVLGMIKAILNGFAGLVTALDKVVSFVEQNPYMSQFGVIGYLLFGKYGLAIGGIIGGVADQVGKLLDVMKSKGLTLTGEEGKDFWGQLPTVPEPATGAKPQAKGSGSVLEGFANGLRDLAAGIGKVSADAAAGAGVVAKANGLLSGGGAAGKGAGTKDKFSDEAKKLADALGISAKEAESRLVSARAVALEVAAAVQRAKEQEDLLKEVQEAAQEGALKFAQEYAEEVKWSYEQGLTTAQDYFEYTKGRLAEATAGTREWRDAFQEAQDVASSLASEELEKVKTLFDEGRLTANQYRDALQEILDRFGMFPGALKDVQDEMTRVNDQTKKWTEDFKMGVVDAILGAKSFLEVLQDIGREILKAMLYKFLWGEGGMLSFLGFHAGGVVGWDSPTFKRSLALPLPRFHSGGVIGGDERLAILQTGERVLSRDQNKAFESGGSGTMISVNIKAIDAQGVKDFFEKNRGHVEGIVTQNLWRNGKIRTALQSI
jgi:hypothetical protein